MSNPLGVNLKDDFGAAGDGQHPDTSNIQSALNSLLPNGGIVFFPPGIYKIDATLRFDDGIVFQGAGPNSTIIKSNIKSSIIQSRNTHQRHNYVHIRDLQIANTTKQKNNNTGIGIDFTNIVPGVVRDVVIKNVETGILLSNLAYYNELFSPVIFDATTGIKIVNGANENHIFGGRIQNVKFGVNLDDISNPQIYGTCIEHFSIGLKIGPKAVSSPKIIGSRLENKPKHGIGIRIASTTQAAHIIGPYFQELSTDIEDIAQDSNIIADQRWQISSNTIIKQHHRMSETVNSTTVGKQSAIDHTIQANIANPENYSIFVTPPPNIPAGLLVSGIPALGGITIRITNITMGDLQLSDSEFIVDIWRH